MARANSKKDARTVVRAIARTRANMVQTAKLSTAAASVIGARMAMGHAALLDPASADHAEFTRMHTEKAIAAQASVAAALARSPAIAARWSSHAMNEVATAWGAGIRMAASRTPAGLVQAQMDYIAGAMGRAASLCLGLGEAALSMTGAMTAPVLRTAAANVRRLA